MERRTKPVLVLGDGRETADVLRDMGYEVATGECGREEGAEFVVVETSADLPIPAVPSWDRPLFVVTASPGGDDRIRAMHGSVDYVLVRPVSAAQIRFAAGLFGKTGPDDG